MSVYRFLYVGVGLAIMFFQFRWGYPVERRAEWKIETRPAFHVIVPGTEELAPEEAIVYIPQKNESEFIVFRDRVVWQEKGRFVEIPLNEIKEYGRDRGSMRILAFSGAEIKTYYMGPLVTKVENALAHLLQS